MNNVTVIGLDLAKHVFQVHGMDSKGTRLVSRKLSRKELPQFFATIPPCLIGIEACGGAHAWARKLMNFGHTVKMMAPQYVKAFVQGNKTDARDAAAIAEAAVRASIPSVKVKSVDEQQLQAILRVRSAWIKQRTALTNMVHGLIGEFGDIFPKGVRHFSEHVVQWQNEHREQYPMMIQMLDTVLDQFRRLSDQLAQIDRELQLFMRNHVDCQRIASVPGVGPVTATTIIAQFSDAQHFSSARKFACAIGLTPYEHSSGGKQILLGMSKRGNARVRELLIHGARAVLRHKIGKVAHANDWEMRLLQRRGHNIAVCALAAKNARRIWALLRNQDMFRTNVTGVNVGTA